MAEPYQSPPGYHKHECKFCAFVWEHHDANDVRHGDYGAHECPACHRCNWSLGIYEGPREPAVRNGRAPPEAGVPVIAEIHPDQRHATGPR
jgi:hypothetical protein